MRALLAGRRRGRRAAAPAHRQRRAPRLSRYSVAHAAGPQLRPDGGRPLVGAAARRTGSTVRAHFQAELLLDRYGVLTKARSAPRACPAGSRRCTRCSAAFEDAGRCQRGYFVESLGGAQFAVASTVDRLRTYLDGVDAERRDYPSAVVLAAADPANPYGAALPWPEAPTEPPAGPQGRRAGGAGRRRAGLVPRSAADVAADLHRRPRGRMPRPRRWPTWSQRAGGIASGGAGRRRTGTAAARRERSALTALSEAGFIRTPRGLRLR